MTTATTARRPRRKPAGAPAPPAATVRSCHIAGDCAANVAAPPVSDADANSGVA